MTTNHSTSVPFLTDTTTDRLQEAVADNHREWMLLKARAMNGEVHESEGVSWTYAGPEGEAMILFPRLDDASADETLDTIAAFYAEHAPEPLVGCWSLDPPQPSDLDIRLLARGFQPGWQPHWMWLDLRQMNGAHAHPDGLRIEITQNAVDHGIPGLPYHSRSFAVVRAALTRQHPRRVWHFTAWLGDALVGHSTLCLTTGPLGVAGLYDIGVVPEARGQGIGKAVTLAACQYAREQGGCHALLNATGERMYEQVGFQSIGFGQTWWLNARRLAANLPTKQRIALAEAIGRGDLDTLEAMRPQLTRDDLSAPLTNGMTLWELAEHANQPPSVAWLTAQTKAA